VPLFDDLGRFLRDSFGHPWRRLRCEDSGSLLALVLTFADDGLVEFVSDGIWEGINFVVSVNFDGFTRCVADNEAVVAPLEVLFQLRFKLDVDIAVQVLV